MGTNPLLGQLEGVGPKNLDCIGPKWHSIPCCHFRAPKRFKFSGSTPSNGPYNGFVRIKSLFPRHDKQQIHWNSYTAGIKEIYSVHDFADFHSYDLVKTMLLSAKKAISDCLNISELYTS
jgi:hypothetical protein